jgi:hypothetical protein
VDVAAADPRVRREAEAARDGKDLLEARRDGAIAGDRLVAPTI